MVLRIKIFLCLLAILSFGTGVAFAQIYVSSSGSDSNDGSKHSPLASLHAARDVIRKIMDNKGSDILLTVIIEDGRYEMSESFVLNAGDSGTKNNPVIYKAAKRAHPVFSGGRRISGFKVNDKGVWEVKIPECENGDFRFDQLYVNGKRAVLARTPPNDGFLKIKDIREDVQNRVGRGIIPPPSHTTKHALALGGFS